MADDSCDTASAVLYGVSFILLCRQAVSTHLAVIAMNKKWVVLSIESDLENGVHDVLWNFNLIGAFHIDDNMANSVGFHECGELGREVLLYEGATNNELVNDT